MATSTAEFKNLVSNYKTITAASRASGNTDPAIKGQLEGLQSALAPYVAEGYTAGGYDDADTISKDVANYIQLIQQNIDEGKTAPKDPAATKADANADAKQDDAKINRVTKEVENKSNDDSGKEKEKQTSDTPEKESPNSSGPTSNGTAASGPNKRTYNPLGDFSSYTYRISLYAFPPEALNTYSKTGRFDNKDLYLIVQSGGSNVNLDKDYGDAGMQQMDAQRGEGFDLDFYIDDLEILSMISSKDVGISANSMNFKFKIVEPYGMTFPTKLVNQQVEIQKKAKMKRPIKDQVAALRTHLLLSIRFYGYDENGNVLTNSMIGGNISGGIAVAPLDLDATFERNFPLVINEFKFRIDGKATIYDINAKSVAEQVSLGAKRGVMPESVKASGATVSEILGGQGKSGGIFDQLNKAQEEKVNKAKTQEIADVFEVVYENESIANSSIIDDTSLNKSRVEMGKVAAKGVVKPAGTVMKKNRSMSFPAGVPITQAIDQIVTQSSFITSALTYTDDEKTQPPQDGESLEDSNAKPKTVQWYITAPTVEILGWDKLRNDFAYKTTYVIKSYDIPYVVAPNVKFLPKFPGPHKIYNYWYTGKNSEVLSYEQSYNLLYFSAASLASKKENLNLESAVPVYQKPAQGEASVGKPSGTFDSINTVKTFLYSPKDQLHAKIKILGDPDFLMPAIGGTVQSIMNKWYGPNFSINPNTGQVFIEIVFNQVEDYTNSDGLLKPNGNIEFWNYPKDSKMGSLTKGMIYQVYRVTSRFSRGMFTQEFMTGIPNFAQLGDSNTGASGSRAGGTNTGSTGSGRETAGSGPKGQSGTASDSSKRASPGEASTVSASGRETSGKIISAEQIKQAKKTGSTVDDDQSIPESNRVSKSGREVSGKLQRINNGQ